MASGVQLSALLSMLVMAPVIACAQSTPPTPATIDAAAKKLAGAEGLLARGQYDLARQELQEFLQTYPKDSRISTARYDRGVCDFNLSDPASAVTDLAAATSDAHFAKRDEALSLLGTVYLQQGQLDQSLATLNLLLKDFPQSPQVESARVNIAQALYRLGRFEESLNAVRDLLKAFPKSAYRGSALYVGAIDQRNLGDEKEAERTLREVISAYPNAPFVYDARLMIGETLTAQARFDDAVAYYRQLQTDLPESRKPAAQFGLASTLLRAGRYGEAEHAFDSLLQNYANSAYAGPAALQRAVAQLKSGRRNDARSALATVARQYPSLAPSAAYWLARCDLLDAKYDAAARQLERLVGQPVDKLPEAPDAEFDLAFCELRLAHNDVALQRLEAFRTKYPRSPHVPEALYYEASALSALGQFEKSVEFADAVDKYGATSVQRSAAMLKGENLLMLRQYSKADAVFAPLEQSAATDDERLKLRFRRGQCAYFSGDYANAESRLAEVSKSALRGDPALSDATFLLGDAELQQGKDAQAEATLKDFLAAAPAKDARRNEATFKLATAQEHLKQDAVAAATLHTLMNADDLKSPWTQRAWFEYGQLAYQRGDTAEASKAIDTVLNANPDPAIAAPALYLMARIDMAAGNNDQAAARLADLIKTFPQDPRAQDAAFVRGVALEAAHHSEDAERQFAAYLQTYPSGKYVTEARHKRAVALAGTKTPQANAEAIRVLSDLAAGTGRTDSVLYDLAWAYRSNNDDPKAEATYQTLLKDFPNGPQATPARVELAQMLFAHKQYKDAQSLLSTALTDRRADAHLRGVATYWSAASAARLGDDAAAAKQFDAFLAANPKDPLVPDALGEAGAAYANLGKFDEAESRQRRVISDFANTNAATLATIRLGEAQNQAGDYPSAASTFTQWIDAHANDPLMPRAHFGLGWSLENTTKLDDARHQYGQVITAANGDIAARAQFQIGETYFSQKQYETAARELLKVDILYAAPQWSARALYEAGRAFEQLHQPDRAKEQFSACTTKYKDSDVAPLAQKRLDTLQKKSP